MRKIYVIQVMICFEGFKFQIKHFNKNLFVQEKCNLNLTRSLASWRQIFPNLDISNVNFAINWGIT